MKRQAMTVTIEQLRVLADDLEDQIKEQNKQGIPTPMDTKFQINIVNPQEECSDTWKIEDEICDPKQRSKKCQQIIKL